MPGFFVFAFVIFFFSALLIWAVRHRNLKAERLDYVWRRTAEEMDGRFFERGRVLFGAAPRRIEVSIDGRPLVLDHYSHTGGGNYETDYFTRIVTHCDAPLDLKLSVTKASALAAFGRAVGLEDIPVGDEAFDAEYVVKSSDPELAPWWINRTVRRAIVDADVGYRFSLRRGEVSAVRRGIDDDMESLAAATRALAAFADGKQRLLRAWGRLARDFDGEAISEPHGWVRVEAAHESVRFTVSLEDVRDHHFTVVEAKVTNATHPVIPFVLAKDAHLYGSTMPRLEPPPFPTAGYLLYGLDAAKIEATVTPGDVEALAQTGAAKLRVEEHGVRLMLYGIVTRKKTLHDAVALVTRLAARPTERPYR
ncbi:MAG: hypothetical protein AAGN82_14650 [Myxococcota bacterium]